MGFRKGWIGVDLDGTLAEPFQSYDEIGHPNPKMVAYVRNLIYSQGEEVRIFTARVSRVQGVSYQFQTRLIQIWCVKNIGCVLPITCEKNEGCIKIIDDIAVNPKDL